MLWAILKKLINGFDNDIGRFYTRDVLPVWTSFGKNFVISPVIHL